MVKNILNGNFQELPKQRQNSIQIFLSSTFSGIYFILYENKNSSNVLKISDYKTERNYLMEHVYDELRTFCLQKYGIEFIVIKILPK